MSTDTINLNDNQFRDNNGHIFFKKGTLPQLMTPFFMLFIIFSQPIFTAIQVALPSIGWLISLVLFTVWFVYDRESLKKEGAFVPSAWWWLIAPVYIYKRQNRNGNSRLWFVWYILSGILSIFVAVVVAAALGVQL
ncbi:hypothetical protein MOC16_gp148 [Klebsiella phage vB_KpM_FBKp24]|uniref:Uncharacterized protein n=1 Tax=Klebsiella phage vB_KpM_FBKp24 TaxID=2801834 RepID=A0A7U0J6D2_9CAUD|nr:hypothetical protein MOC16_gp148 [Klebsiella phage vB_KpM_FBKp24]QQV92230.1 hypothetical protein vBKpMFBKp24_265 [Klebsiella phage vB_KpM_FBKp24]